MMLGGCTTFEATAGRILNQTKRWRKGAMMTTQPLTSNLALDDDSTKTLGNFAWCEGGDIPDRYAIIGPIR